MLRLVSERVPPPVADNLISAWIRVHWQWQIVWLRGYAAGLTVLADLVSAELERIRS